MAKTRRSVPKAVEEQVLKEYSYRCAICAGDGPQLHHLDENPSNNDPMNLIPLCPNCHLRDQHNPTKALDPKKLHLFRRYKDPTILKPQFHPLFLRLQILDEVHDDCDTNELIMKAGELVDFIANLEMGDFYSKQLASLISMPATGGVGMVLGDPESERRVRLRREEFARTYREQLHSAHDRVLALAIELLRFQKW